MSDSRKKAFPDWLKWSLIGLIPIGIIFFLLMTNKNDKNQQLNNTGNTIPTTEPSQGVQVQPTQPEIVATVAPNERQQIDAWIKENDLNMYGDPKDTAYIGGTPLFNEATGQSIDKYTYIVNKHQDKPWTK